MGNLYSQPLVPQQSLVNWMESWLRTPHPGYKPIFSMNAPSTAAIVLPSCKHPFSICRSTLPGKAKGIEISSLQHLCSRAAIPLGKEQGCSCEPAAKSSSLGKNKQSIRFVTGLFLFQLFAPNLTGPNVLCAVLV